MMRKVTREIFSEKPDKYELRSGSMTDAPSCPYGNSYQWIGFDKEKQEYVRFSKRLFKSLVQEYNK